MRSNDVNLALKSANYSIIDSYIKRTMDNDPSVNPNNIQRDILFRIGCILDCSGEIPQNFDIFATLVGELVKRYSANYYTTGLPRKVTHWEVWSEPYLTFTWNNNKPSVFYNFYSKVVRMIKSIDPEAKVGTNRTTNGTMKGGADIDGLVKYCQTTNTPLDFIAWHHYRNVSSDPQNIRDSANQI